MGKHRIIWTYALEKYRSFLLSKKNVLMIYSLVFIVEDIILKMVDVAKTTHFSLNKFEPYVLMLTDTDHFILIPLVFLTIISGYPQMDGQSILVVYRTGKRTWLIANLLYACLVGMSFLASLALVSCLFTGKYGAFGLGWSGYSEQLYEAFPEVYQSNEQLFLSDRVVTHGNVLEVGIHSSLLVLSFLIIIAQILCAFRLCGKQGIGIFCVICLLAIGWLTARMQLVIQWAFPISHMLYETHYNSFLSGNNCSLTVSYLYFALVNLILFWLNQRLIVRYKDW